MITSKECPYQVARDKKIVTKVMKKTKMTNKVP
jgi:hypothetical protein